MIQNNSNVNAFTIELWFNKDHNITFFSSKLYINQYIYLNYKMLCICIAIACKGARSYHFNDTKPMIKMNITGIATT